PVQFKDPSLTSRIVAALARSGLSARRLELEITETTMLQDSEATLSAMHQLQTLGVRMSLDDFGTGYSSLSYLRILPVSTIKLDKSFLHGVPDSADARAVTRFVIQLARDLHLNVIAEGVEREEQAQFLIEQGCHVFQGHLYAKPMDAATATAWLLDHAEAGEGAPQPVAAAPPKA
ncbi:MAG: EAL domain-containing protein, partial [Duganella sp.]